jgi:hypothetical protein
VGAAALAIGVKADIPLAALNNSDLCVHALEDVRQQIGVGLASTLSCMHWMKQDRSKDQRKRLSDSN